MGQSEATFRPKALSRRGAVAWLLLALWAELKEAGLMPEEIPTPVEEAARAAL